MDKKPFHVMRLRKALDKYLAFPPDPPSILNLQAKSTSTNATVASFQTSPAPSDPIPPNSHTSTFSQGPKPNQDPMISRPDIETSTANSQSSSNAAVAHHHLAQGGSVTLFLPPYLHPDADSTSNFDELIDDQTPIQKSLNPPPCKPATWDPKRKSLIQKYAAIYGKNIDKRQKEFLSPFEEHVNEAAYQLCMRDPTLLVRRDELFLLSKRAVKEGGYAYYHGFSKSPESQSAATPTSAPAQKRMKRNEPPASVNLPAVKFSKFTTMDTSSRLSGQERTNRMSTLKTLIEANKAQQAVKVTAMETARRNSDFSTAFNLQLEVESLGTACQQLMIVYARLKRKQARSDRYFRAKNKEKQFEHSGNLQSEHSEESDTGDDELSPIPQVGLSPESGTANDSDTQAPHVVVIDDTTMEMPFLSETLTRATSSLPKTTTTRASKRKETIKNVTATVLKRQQQTNNGPEVGDTKVSAQSSETEIQDLVNNISNATDQVNSLMTDTVKKGNGFASSQFDALGIRM